MTVPNITQSEQRLYQRLIVWRQDFRDANYFANFLLRKGWHFDPWDKKIRWTTYMQQAAYTTALITSYCRPFIATRSGAILPRNLRPYDAVERELHNKMRSLRNTVYAHSDVELREVREFSVNGYATAIERVPSLKLTRGETELTLSMIEKTSKAIDSKLQDLIKRVEN
ncbi:hypothetical protein JWJ90_13495 [Desulfobulbus rhabdoformis]|uniref:hypothetical protein n=1 Tax=Desulfobulbus rhabdoformis TaxID=34032 RepID=UPI001964FC8D|nr:hypothetical protein [Desulfobulbus rhabdoformis]MBM9615293.1 hypothetical protein [Desulfobulbus rhabdoformis]